MSKSVKEPLTMSVSEFSELSGIRLQQVYKYIENDELGIEPIRIGKKILLPRKAVMALLNGESEVC